jgi:hypothetical protein
MKELMMAFSITALFFAHSAFAAVVVNEIAWMGSASSSSDEWIELHNDSTNMQDLTGWKITGKGGANIALLSGSIPPNGYFLVERSDDGTVPEVKADLVVSFGKGISNDGETLKLVDGGGNTVDTVIGGKNWSKIGGDKTSKQTPQRTPSGWITAPATPRASNKTPSVASEIAAPVTKTRVAQPVKVANAETLKEENVWPAKPAIPPIRAVAEEKKSGGNNQIISTSSVSANVLWQRGKNADAEKRAWAWMIVAVLLVIAASLIIMRANVYEPTEADKYAIIEDIIEGKDDANDRLSDY